MLEAGKYYHIYNRGNNKENIFKEERNYAYFLSLWQQHVLPIADAFAYCLLPNHFHFCIRSKEHPTTRVEPSKAFGNLFNAYAKAINKKHERVGSLFQERFRRKEIDSDLYLTRLILYIHSNAARHGICNGTVYRHSSYPAYLSQANSQLCREEIMPLFGTMEQFISAHQHYTYQLEEASHLLELAEDD